LYGAIGDCYPDRKIHPLPVLKKTMVTILEDEKGSFKWFVQLRQFPGW
jgi:hypothetical protein